MHTEIHVSMYLLIYTKTHSLKLCNGFAKYLHNNCHIVDWKRKLWNTK